MACPFQRCAVDVVSCNGACSGQRPDGTPMTGPEDLPQLRTDIDPGICLGCQGGACTASPFCVAMEHGSDLQLWAHQQLNARVDDEVPTQQAASKEPPSESTVYWLQRENQDLRKMLAYARTPVGLYTDDGELQDNSQLPGIDYKRDSPQTIEQKTWERHQRAASKLLTTDDRGYAKMPVHSVHYFDFGMGVLHDMPCAVYPSESAYLSDGNFQPGSRARSEGWRLHQFSKGDRIVNLTAAGPVCARLLLRFFSLVNPLGPR